MKTRHTTQLFLIGGLVASLCLGLVGCGGGSSPGGGMDKSTGQLAGQVTAPNGQTPIAGAKVKLLNAAKNVIAETHSAADGAFSFSNVPAGSISFTIESGRWRLAGNAMIKPGERTEIKGDGCKLPRNENDGAPRFAVVASRGDRLQDTLAKLGMGEVDSGGNLIRGTEKFTLIDGDGSLGNGIGWEEFIKNPPSVRLQEILLISSGSLDTMASDAGVVATLRAYVEAGGKLIITNTAYDFVEQPFSAAIDFFGGDSGLNDSPEVPNAAEFGPGGIIVQAKVEDDLLKAWLQVHGVLNLDGTLTLSGFPQNWAMIDRLGEGTKSWLNCMIDETTRPLAASFRVGAGQVAVLSFTMGGAPTRGLSGEEYFLAFVLFQM